MTTVREALSEASRRLAAAGVEDAQREVVWLLAHVLCTTAGTLRLQANRELEPGQVQAFSKLVHRRAQREPLQYILGTQEFMGLTFQVTPAVLVPRLDTEVLVQEAAARLQDPVLVADVGTGSGAIAVSLARLLPEARVVAVDVSSDALAVAERNAVAHGVAARIDFRQGDLLAPLVGQHFDAIVSNPPYISEPVWQDLMPEVRDWEPKEALCPGADGLLMYRRLIQEGTGLLKPGGFLAVEVGMGQASSVQELFYGAGLDVSVSRDTAGIHRVVVGRKLRRRT